MDRGARWATVYGIPKSWTRFSGWHFHFHFIVCTNVPILSFIVQLALFVELSSTFGCHGKKIPFFTLPIFKSETFPGNPSERRGTSGSGYKGCNFDLSTVRLQKYLQYTFLKCKEVWSFIIFGSFKMPILGERLGLDWNAVFLAIPRKTPLTVSF